jgi:hypothetical protein
VGVVVVVLLLLQMDAKWLGDEYSKVPGVPKKVSSNRVACGTSYCKSPCLQAEYQLTTPQH